MAEFHRRSTHGTEGRSAPRMRPSRQSRPACEGSPRGALQHALPDPQYPRGTSNKLLADVHPVRLSGGLQTHLAQLLTGLGDLARGQRGIAQNPAIPARGTAI